MKKNTPDKEITIDLSRAESYFRADGMTILNRNFHFLQDTNFIKIHENLCDGTEEKKRIWKNHIYCSFFENGLKIEGDLIECGVYRGFASAVACHYLNFQKFTKKKLFLFDTWDGIPNDQLDNIRKQYDIINKKYKSKDNLLIVEKRFRKFKNVIKVKGKIPDIFKSIKLPKKISFLHLDMNTHIGEIAALKVLFPRLVKGGVCLLDDFGMSLAKEQMLEEKKWFSKINYNICELPTGQAFVIKH